jgi:uncharacterized protein YcnI
VQKPKLAVAFVAVVIALVALAAPAGAHVSINPAEAAQGSTTTIALMTEDESTTSDTVMVDVKLPDEVASASVSVEPTDGWTAQLVRSSTGAVSEVIWTTTTPAPGDGGPFTITLGPLPAQGSELRFPTIQTYGDGTEDAWIEPPLPGGGEPEHPAPTLKLTAAPGGSTTSTTAASITATSSGVTTTAAPATTAAKKDDDSKLPLIAAVVVVLALVAGIGLYVRSRRA